MFMLCVLSHVVLSTSAFLHIIVWNVINDISSASTLIIVLILFLYKYLINENFVFIEKATKGHQLLKQHVLLSGPKCHEVEPLHTQYTYNSLSDFTTNEKPEKIKEDFIYQIDFS